MLNESTDENIAVLKSYLDYGALFNPNDVWWVLNNAVEQNDTNKVKFLLEIGVPVNTQNDNNRYYNSAICHVRSIDKSQEIIQMLIKANANINLTDSKRQTALHDKTKGKIDPIEFNRNRHEIDVLLKLGIDVNALDDNNNTALINPVCRCEPKVAQVDESLPDEVIDDSYGAIVTYPNEDKFKPSKLSKEYNDFCLAVIKSLLDAKAHADIKNKEDKTAIDYALEKKLDDEIIKLLVEKKG